MVKYDDGVIPAREQLFAQLRKGVLEYCVLAELAVSPSYGQELAATLARRGVLFTSGGALYPVLSRLREAEWVATHWEESATGPPRKYYAITDEGLAGLDVFSAAWGEFSRDVNHALSRRVGSNGQN